jgi:hypothetical protein
MADRGNLGGVRRLPVRQPKTGRPLPSHRQRAALQDRGARPEPTGSLATAPPCALKNNAVRWLLFFLSAAASLLGGRCRLRGDVGRPLSHQGDGGKPGGPLR